MTEDSRRSVDAPPHEDGHPAPGLAAGRHDEEPGTASGSAQDAPRVATDSDERAEPVDGRRDDLPRDLSEDDRSGDDSAHRSDDAPAGAGFAPPDDLGTSNDDKLLVSASPPVADEPAQGGYGSYGQPQPPHGEAPSFAPVAGAQGQGSGHPQPDSRPRPGFVPHDQPVGRPVGEPGGYGGYGWAAYRQDPPPPSGPPVSTAPPPPDALPLGQVGPPNWAPVPALPQQRRTPPSLGVLAAIGLIVALVAGAVGAGIGVMATGGDSSEAPPISLGGGGGGDSEPVKPRPPDSVAGIAQKVLPSVVTIRVSAGGEGGSGTGFIVNGGYIITNNHVVSSAARGGGQIEIVFHDKKTSPAEIQGRDPASDIAVLKPRTTHNLPALTLGDSDDLAVGDPVIAVGSPLGLDGSVTSGIVSALNRAVPTRGEGADAAVIPAIQTDAAINPGNSGGPLVNGKGEVVGINTAIVTLGGGLGEQGGNIGLGFAIPINHGRRIAEEIINTGSARRTMIGIGMDTTFPGPGVRIADREQNGVPPIVEGGPADKAGLKPGDIITAIDGQVVEDRADLSAAIQSKAPGTKVKVTFQRDGKEQTVEVTLAASD